MSFETKIGSTDIYTLPCEKQLVRSRYTAQEAHLGAL